MNKLQTIMVLIMVCARCSIGQYVLTKTQPYQVFKPIQLLPTSCSNKQKDYQECRKKAFELYQLHINDYFTATDIFCCFVQKVSQCEEQIAEKCDALEGWNKKNRQQKKDNLFSSCFKKQYSCKTATDQTSTNKEDGKLTLEGIIAIILLIGLIVLYSCVVIYYGYKTCKKAVPEPNGEVPVSLEPKPSKVTSVLEEPKPSGETGKQSILTETVEQPISEQAEGTGILNTLTQTITGTASSITGTAQKTGGYLSSFLWQTKKETIKEENDDDEYFELNSD